MPEIKVKIDVEANAAQGANAAKDAIKGVTDESARYQQVLEKMASGDADASQAKRFEAVRTQAQAYVPVAQAAAEAEKRLGDASRQAAETDRQMAEAGAKLAYQLNDERHAEEEAGHAIEEVTGHGRAQHMVFSELNKIVPGLGHAIHAAFAGPLGPIILLGTGIAEVTSKLAEFNEELDKQAQANANADFLGNILGRLKEVASAASDAQAFADSLNNIVINSVTLNTQLQAQLNLMQAIERAQAAQVSSQKALAIAKIQEDEARHKITPEQAAERRAQTEKDAISQQEQAKEKAEDDALRAKADTLKKAQDQQKALEDAADAAAAQVAAEKQHDQTVALDPKEQLQKIKEQQNAVDQAQQLVDAYHADNLGKATLGQQWKVFKYGLTTGVGGDDTKSAESELDRAKAKQAQLQQQLDAYNASISPQNAAKEGHDVRAAGEADHQAQENLKLIMELTTAITELKNTIAAVRPIEQGNAARNQQTVDAQENARIAAEFERDARTLNSFARAHNPSTELYDKMKAAMEDIVGILRAHSQLVKALPDYADAIKDLKRDAEAAHARESNARNFGTSG